MTRLREFLVHGLLTCLLAGTAVPARAAGVHVGVEGGLTLSKLASTSLNSIPGLRNLKSGAAGLYVSLPLAPGVDLQPELLYLDKGVSLGKSDQTDTAGNLIGTFESLYSMPSLELPLLVRVAPPALAGLHPVVLAGPFLSAKLSESFKLTGGSSTSIPRTNFKSTDYGLQLGAGLEFPAGPGRLTLNGRFDLGLADVGRAGALATDAVHSRTLLVMAGFRF
jgi:hypothetical protein